MSSIYPLSTAEIRHKRHDLAPAQQAAFKRQLISESLSTSARV